LVQGKYEGKGLVLQLTKMEAIVNNIYFRNNIKIAPPEWIFTVNILALFLVIPSPSPFPY
jgi:hypothetical protein